jgi:hypothetical protein
MAKSGAMHKSVQENFSRRADTEMSPYNVLREARDSQEHPNTVPFIVALDVTGSMGVIPQMFLLEGLPTLMSVVFAAGVKDPQLCFAAIGDHEYDQAPLQVGQFESSDELVDKWLQKVWPERGGGGNNGESYMLAWLFAAYQTITDSFEKRGQKGFLFTIGDEHVLKVIPESYIKNITGLSQVKTSSAELLEEARKKYHVYHIHTLETSSGSSDRVQRGWKEMMGEDCIFVKSFKDIPDVIGKKIVQVLGNSVSAVVDVAPNKQPDNSQHSSGPAEPVVY